MGRRLRRCLKGNHPTAAPAPAADEGAMERRFAVSYGRPSRLNLGVKRTTGTGTLMGHRSRVIAVVASLILVGAILGAIAAVLAVLSWGAVDGVGPLLDNFSFLVFFVGGLGAVLGAVLAPLVMWTILRRVPLGWAISLTFFGTIIGGAIGMVVRSPILGALLGFFIAAIC